MRGIKIVLLVAFSSAVTTWGQETVSYLESYTPNSRYIVDSDGTVTDKQTGLMWNRCVEGLKGRDCNQGEAEIYIWSDALSKAAQSNYAGYDDWRVPNIKELGSLTAMESYDPAINSTIFPHTPSANFWSETPAITAPGEYDQSRIIDFMTGVDGFAIRLKKEGYLRLVRNRAIDTENR